MKKGNMDSFLDFSKKYLKGEYVRINNKDTDMLSSIAIEGKRPCDYCKQKETCARLTCIPFYAYFSIKWNQIQRRLCNEMGR